MNLVKALKKSDIFKKFNDEEVTELIKKVKYSVNIYEKDEYIAYRGEKVESLMIILSGTVITEMLSSDGNVRKIEELSEGRVLASAFLFGEKNIFPVDIISKQRVEIFYIKRDAFVNLLVQDKKLMKIYLDEISSKAQLLSMKIWQNFNNRTISEKFDNYVAKNRDRDLIQIESLKSLAESFGVARPSLSRVLKNYIDDGVLERQSRNMYKIIKDIFN